MATLINDTEAMELICRSLENAVSELNEDIKQAESTLTKVEEDWKDTQEQQFRANFDDDVKREIPRIEQMVGEFHQKLTLLKQALENYLNSYHY